MFLTPSGDQVSQDTDVCEPSEAGQPAYLTLPRENDTDEQRGENKDVPRHWKYRETEGNAEEREMVQLNTCNKSGSASSL